MRSIGRGDKVAATHLLLGQRYQAVFDFLQCPEDHGFIAARRLLLPFVLDDEVLAKLPAIEQLGADRGAGAPEPRARHEEPGDRQRFESDRSGESEAWIEIRARHIHLCGLRSELSFCATHVGPTAERVSRHAERGLDRCLRDGSRRVNSAFSSAGGLPEKNGHCVD